MALALEISITRRLENLLTCWFVDLLARWLVDFRIAHRACVKFTVLRRMEGRDTVAECFELLFNGVIRVIKLDVKRETLTPYD